MNRHLRLQPQRQLQHQLLQRQSHQQRQLRCRGSQLKQRHLQVKTVDRKELVEHYRQAQPLRFLVQQVLRLDHLEPTELVVQPVRPEQPVLLVQLVQVQEQEQPALLVLEASEEPLAQLAELDPVRHHRPNQNLVQLGW
jgi:hypothetical protein